MTTKTGVSSNVDIEVVVSEFVKRFDWKDLGVNIADFDRLRKSLEECFLCRRFLRTKLLRKTNSRQIFNFSIFSFQV